jgi:hypothetical protein
MQSAKRLFAAILTAVLLASIGGCVYYVNGPYVRPYPRVAAYPYR